MWYFSIQSTAQTLIKFLKIKMTVHYVIFLVPYCILNLPKIYHEQVNI